jgi:hypothetical protein
MDRTFTEYQFDQATDEIDEQRFPPSEQADHSEAAVSDEP